MNKILTTFKAKCPALKNCLLETIIGVVLLGLLTNFIYAEFIDKWINPIDSSDDNKSDFFSGINGDVRTGNVNIIIKEKE